MTSVSDLGQLDRLVNRGDVLRRRLEGWEMRLNQVIEAARVKDYELGKHDCVRLACATAEALTGLDLWAPIAGRYASRREAHRLVVEYGGSFTGAFSRLFDIEPCALARARRGDVAEYRGPAGDGLQVEPHLVIVLGARCAGLGEHGLYFIRRELCAHAWRIG